MRRPLLAVALAALTLTLAACSSTTPAPDAGGTGTAPIKVVTAFYPLEYLAEQLGGDQVSVSNLTPPGGEPHDLELTPQQVAEIGDADLVLYIKGFQPAVDEAVAQQAAHSALDVSADLSLLPAPHEAVDEAPAAGAHDPHVWLDPLNMEAMGTSVAARLAQIRAEAATSFTKNAASLSRAMTNLDQQWADGTRSCRSKDLVVSHEAFGYLAKRYGFTQIGIAGLSPDAEPSPAKVAEVADFVKAHGISTIYYESLVDPKIAETVATETGAQATMLDPLEGLVEGSTGNYLSVMQANLAAVQTGNGCT